MTPDAQTFRVVSVDSSGVITQVAPLTTPPVVSEVAPPPVLEREPEKADAPMTDSIVSPSGQTVLAGNDHDNGFANHAALLTLSGQQQAAVQVSNEGRFTSLQDIHTQRALHDLEARNADRIATVLTAIKDENARTRDCVLHQKIDDLRFSQMKAELLVATKG